MIGEGKDDWRLQIERLGDAAFTSKAKVEMQVRFVPMMNVINGFEDLRGESMDIDFL